jgi:uncharacterized protein YukE
MPIYMNYEGIKGSAQSFEEAGQTYSDMVDKLRATAEALSEQCFVGQTGNAARLYIEMVIEHLNALGMQAFYLRDALLATNAQFRDELDPQVAGTFQTA